uniref:EB domain-containing protein n=1 Tax=Dracunculus medinensis TaxID=318479 RepID=A0A0N4URY3_DRAME
LNCNEQPCIAGQNIMANCYYDGESCGSNMIFETVIRLYSPIGIGFVKCVLLCSCISTEFIIVNGQCVRNSRKEIGIESQNFECKQKNCALGETIIDPSCAQIGTKCGTNMIFQIADKLKSFNSTALLTKCILRCDCDSGNFIEKNGQCMKVFDEPNTTLSNLLTASKRDYKQQNHALGKITMAFPCVQVGRKCGINMIFKIIDRMEPLSSAPWLTKCIMKCSCDNDNFIENKGKCVKIFDDRITISSSQQSSNQLNLGIRLILISATFLTFDKPKPNFSCHRFVIAVWHKKLLQVTFDPSCQQIGNKCGLNMVFNLIVQILINSCFIRCECEYGFVEKDGQCLRHSIFREVTTTNEDFIASDLPRINEKFYNSDCRQTQLACGRNMKIISIWKNPVDQQNRFACTQFCACNDGFVEINGRCKRVKQF